MEEIRCKTVGNNNRFENLCFYKHVSKLCSKAHNRLVPCLKGRKKKFLLSLSLNNVYKNTYLDVLQ